MAMSNLYCGNFLPTLWTAESFRNLKTLFAKISTTLVWPRRQGFTKKNPDGGLHSTKTTKIGGRAFTL